jgi:hypothetical protein
MLSVVLSVTKVEQMKRAWFRFLHQLGWYPGPGWASKEESGVIRCTLCQHPAMGYADALRHYKAKHDPYLGR